MKTRPCSQRRGSTLMVTLVTLTALSMMTAFAFRRVMPGLRMAHQNAAWQETRVAAEAGVDTAMNDLMLNATGFQPGAWTGWKEEPDRPRKPGLLQPVVKSLKDTLSTTVDAVLGNLVTSLLRLPGGAPAGEPVVSSKAIFLDNVKVSATKGLPAEVDVQLWALTPESNPNTRWFRIRSMATCPLPPIAYEAPANRDPALRRFSLRSVRPSLRKNDVGDPTSIPLPNVSRTVEVLVQPILSFELALWTGERLALPSNGAWEIDSFDSSNPKKSAPGGLYPGRGSKLIQANGYVASSMPPDESAPQPAIAANGTRVRGAVATNGGDDPTTEEHENISGARLIDPARVHDDFSRQMIPLIRPKGKFMPPPANGLFRTGTPSAPTIYSVTGDLSRLRIQAPLLGSGAVVIMIDGKLTLSEPLVIPPSVIAVLYVGGDITFQGNVNSGHGNSNLASHLLIFGDRPSPQRQTLRALGAISVCAAFYGPATEAVLDGAAHWIGSLNTSSFRVAGIGDGGLHYDEALATIGPTIGFRIARYIEDVRE